MASDDESEVLTELAIGQGNEFVQDLLRAAGAKIGTTKAAFRQNLRAALDGGQLSPADIRSWLDSVEGWGDQHCFAVLAPADVRNDKQWKDSVFVQGRVEQAGLGHLWNAERPLSFPGELEVASIQFDGETMSLTWQRALQQERRRSDLDRDEISDEEYIVFKAYSRSRKRLLVRFFWQIGQGIAAVFIPSSRDYSDYEAMRSRITDQLKPLVDISAWPRMDVVRAIRALDDMATAANGGRLSVRPSETTFAGTSSTIQMRSNSKSGNYQDDADVRQVRRTVVGTGLVGNHGDFRLTRPGRSESHLRLLARDQSLLFWGQMEAQDTLGCIFELCSI